MSPFRRRHPVDDPQQFAMAAPTGQIRSMEYRLQTFCPVVRSGRLGTNAGALC